MILIPRQTESAHWYTKDGQPRHHVHLKAKGREHETRPTTLADARKEGWLPSVTSVIKLVRNKFLQDWISEQLVLAALTLPRQPGETDDAFARRVVEDANTQVTSAADFGTAIHACMEDYLANRQRTDMTALLPFAEPVYRWIDENIAETIGAEFRIVCSLGYAGTVDAKVRIQRGSPAWSSMDGAGFNGIALLDAKTRKAGAKGVATYDSDCRQLAAYMQADTMKPAGDIVPTRAASLLIPSNEPQAPVLRAWTPAEVEAGWREFASILHCWQTLNDYKP